jgi:hypothetical protein
MKDSFPKPIDVENLTDFFNQRIGDSSLPIIMSNFGIPDGEPQNKELFIKALCFQFQNIILEVTDDVDDIVATEYSRLLRETGVETTIDTSYYPGDDFLLVTQTPEENHTVDFYEDFEHQWTIKNSGTVTWKDRYLECTNQSKIRIRGKEKIIKIPKVKPGDDVCLTVGFNARGFEGKFVSIWEMKDIEGQLCFTDQKALSVAVNVVNGEIAKLEG